MLEFQKKLVHFSWNHIQRYVRRCVRWLKVLKRFSKIIHSIQIRILIDLFLWLKKIQCEEEKYLISTFRRNICLRTQLPCVNKRIAFAICSASESEPVRHPYKNISHVLFFFFFLHFFSLSTHHLMAIVPSHLKRGKKRNQAKHQVSVSSGKLLLSMRKKCYLDSWYARQSRPHAFITEWRIPTVLPKDTVLFN